MRNALIGDTGFVGGNLLAQHEFEARFNSKNIDEIAGCEFDWLVVAGMPAAKWIANRDPERDRAVLEHLTGCLATARARQVVVISTVDVYPNPVGVDEGASIDGAAQQPYGRHRLMLEQMAASHFDRVLVVRLPGLFGRGLKKNAVYDLLHDNELGKLHAGGIFQFYGLDRLWNDVRIAAQAGVELVNFATEPVSIREIARQAFGIDFDNDTGVPPSRYDMRTKHAELFGGRSGYLCDRKQVLRELADFVIQERNAS
jgi:nucleoside-diphosphate-sugar epimerase